MKTTLCSRLPAIPLLIIALFLLPYLAAHMIYSNGKSWFVHTVNHGELLNPPIPLSDKAIQKSSPKWLLVYVETEPCRQNCLDNLVMLDRISLAFGSDSQRIKKGLIANLKLIPSDQFRSSMENESPCSTQGGELRLSPLGNPHCFVPVASHGVLVNLMEKIHQLNIDLLGKQETLLLKKQGFYIVDPHGNVILYYTAKSDPQPIYDDLKRLLKASQIG